VAERNRAAIRALRAAGEKMSRDQGRAQLHEDKWVLAPAAPVDGPCVDADGEMSLEDAPAFGSADGEAAALSPAPVTSGGAHGAAAAAAAAEKRQAYVEFMSQVWDEQLHATLWPA